MVLHFYWQAEIHAAWDHWEDFLSMFAAVETCTETLQRCELSAFKNGDSYDIG